MQRVKIFQDMQRCGMVAIVGKPNSGKSTLTNAFVGQKVSIVTHKPQTTRRQIQGVAMWDDTQVVFVDTPGIFNSKGKFEEALVDSAYRALNGVDLVLILIDPSDYQVEFLNTMRKRLRNQPYLIVVNKADLKGQVEKVVADIRSGVIPDKERSSAEPGSQEDPRDKVPDSPLGFRDDNIYVISAIQGTGMDELKAAILTHIPEHPWLYEEDQLTNISQKLWSAEIVREQTLLCLHQEVPYALYVDCESYEEQEDGSIRMHHSIIVSADRYKPIVLGQKGSMIKKIGTNARLELEQQLGVRVHLFLNVKVTEKWQDRIHILRREGIIS